MNSINIFPLMENFSSNFHFSAKNFGSFHFWQFSNKIHFYGKFFDIFYFY